MSRIRVIVFVSRSCIHYLLLCVLLCAFYFKVLQVDGSSLMKRIREKQSVDESMMKGLELPTDSWMLIPQQIQDVLSSIDDKLRSLDTFSYTLKLARLDFSLEQLVRRMENIETKLGRLETKFDVRMEKVEEVVIGKDIKEEFSNEHLSRRMENLNEKINTKAAYLDAKIDVKMERVTSKLERLEKDLHNSVDDILEKLIKSDERHAQFETEIMKSTNKIDEFVNNINDLRDFLKEDLLSLFQKHMDKFNSKISDMTEVIQKIENNTSHMVSVSNSVKNSSDGIRTYLQETKVKIENISTSCNSEFRLRSFPEYCNNDKTMPNHSKEQFDNLTATIHKAVKMGESRFRELDTDVEIYTKKVINSIQELWKTSDEMKKFLSNTLEQGNKTREIVRQEFRRLHEQIEPLPKIEPKLSHISENLDKRVTELSTTVDNSFATLLVAQNTFIASCRRIQQEEMHIYDILQQIVFEMRNRSISDIRRISVEVQNQSTEINESLASVLAAVFLVGNTTFNEIRNINDRNKQRCVIVEDSLKWKDISHLCNQAAFDLTEATDEHEIDMSEDLFTEPERFEETELIRNNLIEPNNDREEPGNKKTDNTTIMMNDYENDYPITDNDYVDQETE